MNWKTWMVWGACAIALAAETGAELYQKALVKERGAGNLEEAIQLYQRVAREFPGDRALAAKSLVQAGRCYEKLGQDKAIKLYEQVAREFGDQRESVVTARERLAAMAVGAKPKNGAGMVARQIPVPRGASYAQADGKHVFYVDYTAGGLIVTNMDGTGARVILSTKDTPNGISGVSVAPDGKQVAVSLEMPDRESFCVVGIDGSGFREVYRKPRRGIEPIGGWSPDGTHFLGQILEADGSYTLISIGARDGSVRKLKTDRNITTTASVGGGGRFSPDGKYVIFGVLKGAASEQSDIHILALDGNYEGTLVEHPSANRILGFTPDGRHLLFQSDRSGVPAIYGLAVSDGRGQGQPLLIKQDAGIFAESVSLAKDGTLFYSVGPQQQSQILTVNLDAVRGTVMGLPRPIAERSRLLMRSGAWSPDGRRLAYTSSKDPTHAGILTIQTLDSGQEVSFSTGTGAMGLICWAPDGTAIYGIFSEGAPGAGQTSTVGLQSVSTENGAVKRHATFPRGRVFHSFTPTDGGRALLIAFLDQQPLALAPE